jgi:outer membrane lipoprotein-sorting protein
MIKVILAIFLLMLSSQAGDFSKNPHVVAINRELRNINSLKANFRQVYGKDVETGAIFFKKNQGLFVHYNTTPISILVNKSAVTYYDSKLDQKSQIPTKESASGVFVETLEITEKKFDILNIKELDEAVVIVASLKEKKSEGIFTMYFSKKDYTLRRLDIESPEDGGIVQIDIFSHSNEKISNERFKSINIEKSSI